MNECSNKRRENLSNKVFEKQESESSLPCFKWT